MYSVKEMFYTLQGEGAQAGRPAVFCRFSGCNLWTGREQDRASAHCQFCDTDFVGTNGINGGKFDDADQLANKIASFWPDAQETNNAKKIRKYVVFTGGEPCLQLDENVIIALKKHDFEIAIETNGTMRVPNGVDWICVSPKPGPELIQTSGQELKFVFPQTQLSPHRFENFDFEHFFIQPMDVADNKIKNENLAQCLSFCLENPQWRLSLQTHKLTGLP